MATPAPDPAPASAWRRGWEAVRRPLRWRLRLQRVGGPPRLVWTAAPPTAAEAARRAERDRAARAALDDGLAALERMLASPPDAPLRLRALATLARALRREGPSVLQRWPAPALAEALAQLEGRVADLSPPGLAHLRSVLALALRTQAAATPSSTALPAHGFGRDPRED